MIKKGILTILTVGLLLVLKESSPFREPLKLKMPAGSGHDETDGG